MFKWLKEWFKAMNEVLPLYLRSESQKDTGRAFDLLQAAVLRILPSIPEKGLTKTEIRRELALEEYMGNDFKGVLVSAVLTLLNGQVRWTWGHTEHGQRVKRYYRVH